MLRDFRPGDQPALRGLILDGLRDRWGQVFDADLNPDLGDLVANYLECGAEIVVFESAGEILATGILVADDNATGRIVRMSVAAIHRRHPMRDCFVRRREFSLLDHRLVTGRTPSAASLCHDRSTING